jgi:hypothetical protein
MIPSGVEVFIALASIDLRWGFDRLAGLAQEHAGRSARSGALFVFVGKRKTALKVLFPRSRQPVALEEDGRRPPNGDRRAGDATAFHRHRILHRHGCHRHLRAADSQRSDPAAL